MSIAVQDIIILRNKRAIMANQGLLSRFKANGCI